MKAKNFSVLDMVLIGVAIICLGYYFWKSRIDGFYPWEETSMNITGLIGVVTGLIVAWRLQRQTSAQLREADRAKGVE